MIELPTQLLHSLGDAIVGTVPTFVGLAATFTALSAFFTPCNPGTSWWRKPDLLTDLCYFFIFPLVARIAMLVFLTAGIGILSVVAGGEPQAGLLGAGRGPLGALPFWLQLVLYLVLFDLMLYWSHRAFHTASLWRYHAVHHAPEHLDWISARRFHPVDTTLHSILPDFILLALGISPEVILLLAPFNAWHSALVHANLDWSFGPLKYVLAGPVFHRWHHTDVDRGGSKNFAATFPVLDLIFGTFYMPAGVLPDRYGVDDANFPKSLARQLLYPWVSNPPEPTSEGAAASEAPLPESGSAAP